MTAAYTIESGPFAEKKYCIVRNAMAPASCKLLENYLLLLKQHHQSVMTIEPKSVGRYVDPMGESLLEALKPVLEDATGLTLLPTYSYMRRYENGAELKRHTDRAACEISTTLFLGSDSEEEWPICIEVDGEEKAIHLNPGDMMIYRGTEVPHWRSPFNGKQSSHIFLHYVEEEGENAGLIYDQRDALGAPARVSMPARAPKAGAKQTSKQKSSDKILTVEELVSDPSYFLATFDFEKGIALFRHIDRDLPPNGCRHCEKRPGSAVAIKNLLESKPYQWLPASKPLNFIWMTDYCLSTLYAKALHAASRLYLYHENVIFSQLALLKREIDLGRSKCPPDTWRRLLETALVFQSRTFDDDDVALVKEWPLSNYIISDLLNADQRYRGVFLYASLEEYLTKTLKTASRTDMARMRVNQVYTDIPAMGPFADINLKTLSNPQAVALHWLYLMYSLPEPQQIDTARFKTLFNQNLIEKPAITLSKSAAHFGTPIEASTAQAIVDGPVFKTHSKQGSAFDITAHKRDLEKNRHMLEAQISEGLAFAQKITDKQPLPDLMHYSLV